MYSFRIRKTGVEHWYSIYAATVDPQIAQLRVDPTKYKGFK